MSEQGRIRGWKSIASSVATLVLGTQIVQLPHHERRECGAREQRVSVRP